MRLKKSLLFCCLGIFPVLSFPSLSFADGEEASDVFFVDRMDELSSNERGGRNSAYHRMPSRCGFSKSRDNSGDSSNSVLKIMYDRKLEGGPYGRGGWCGFYSLLKQGVDGYFDATDYVYLTFMVRGEKGGESFQIGLADKMWEYIDDTVKGSDIGRYLPEGAITKEWQRAVIPLDKEYFLEWSQINSLSFCFEGEPFQMEETPMRGTVYIDDIAFTKKDPRSIFLSSKK